MYKYRAKFSVILHICIDRTLLSAHWNSQSKAEGTEVRHWLQQCPQCSANQDLLVLLKSRQVCSIWDVKWEVVYYFSAPMLNRAIKHP